MSQTALGQGRFMCDHDSALGSLAVNLVNHLPGDNIIYADPDSWKSVDNEYLHGAPNQTYYVPHHTPTSSQ